MSEVKKETQDVKSTETKSKTVAARDTAKKEAVIYIGPSIKGLVSTGTIYNNGIPNNLELEMEKQPAIKNLVVPVSELSGVRKELRVPGSALAVIYNKIITE